MTERRRRWRSRVSGGLVAALVTACGVAAAQAVDPDFGIAPASAPTQEAVPDARIGEAPDADGPPVRRPDPATARDAAPTAGGTGPGSGVAGPDEAASVVRPAPPPPTPPRPRVPPPRVDPARVLPGVDPSEPMDEDRARALQEAVRIAREDTADGLLRERIACYRAFFVYRCWSDVDARERRIRGHLDRIEVAANRTLREARALELNQRAAADLAERDARIESDAARREANARQHASRQAAAEDEAARREAEAETVSKRAEANRAERARREAEARARQAEAERRAAQDAPNAAARARELEAFRVQREAADRREAERREARRVDRERRDAEARQRELNPPPPRRPGAKASGGASKAADVPTPDAPPRPTPTLPAAPGTPTAPQVTPMR